jgi:hypothetical protein
MSQNTKRTCPSCGSEFSGAIEFCPVCMLCKGLPGGVESGESSFEEAVKPTPEHMIQRLALRCSLWIALLGGSSVHIAPLSQLKIESDINGTLPAGGGPLPLISFRS